MSCALYKTTVWSQWWRCLSITGANTTGSDDETKNVTDNLYLVKVT